MATLTSLVTHNLWYFLISGFKSARLFGVQTYFQNKIINESKTEALKRFLKFKYLKEHLQHSEAEISRNIVVYLQFAIIQN